ncbi:amino acid adenylation domain-containing protein [Planobispora longispora]|uniref:amino acid adenylation domain-containing protein n=1 Tax=Planobispora longispora TaxID=28887 RepID=UPI00360E9174
MDERRARLEARFRKAVTGLNAERPIARRPGGTAPPLSFAQERLWFMEQFTPGTSAYVLPVSARVRGPVDAALLQERLDALAARHESLRMTFPAGPDGRPEVRIAARPRVPLRVVTAASEQEARQVLSADLALPFDLAAGPLLRAVLVRLAPGDHVLLVAAHHIVTDGWSAGLIVRELLGDAGPPPEIGYGDYALWQRERLTGEVLDRELAFWRAELAGVAPLDLPLDLPRPPVQGVRGGWCDLTVDAEVTGRLRKLAAAEGATPYMALLAAFQALLGRWSGATDFVVGSPVAGRSRPEFEAVVGLFVNLLPMRARLAGDPGFAELLRRTRDAALEVYGHQELPFEKLVAELDPVRDVSRPYLQVLFALQNYRDGGEGFELDTTTTRFDLELYLTESGDGLAGRFVYNRELFLPETVRRLALRFEALLRAVTAGPEVPVGELDLLPPQERELVVSRWNATDREHPGGTLHELIFAQAARTPQATAVRYDAGAGTDTGTNGGTDTGTSTGADGGTGTGAGQLTYRELARYARHLARHLHAAGARPDEPVGVCLERGLHLPAVLLGVLTAGCAYLPLDPADPSARRQAMLTDAGATLLITGAPGGRLQLTRTATGATAPFPPTDTDFPGDHAMPEVHPDNLAYVIFTSGSTGRPKGVAVSHRAIVNRLHWMQAAFRLTPADRVLHKTPTTFDVSVWELFWPLMTGATMVVAAPGGHRDTTYLRDLIERHGVTTTHFVPSMLEAFLLEEDIRLPARVICSGEALPVGIEWPAETELHNLYGPTEAAIDVSWHRCLPGETVVPIGRPVDNTRLYVLDQSLQPVPIGAPGQLHIGGVQLARGYAGRPALTAERFLPDPYGPPGSRLYATGDLARWLPTGELEYLGRTDHQVKIRGMRVELGEVEAVLRERPGVRQAAAGLVDGRLVGYLVGDGGVPDLRAVLPDFMIPVAWVHLDELPLTANGKLDRAALPAPEWRADLPWEPPRAGAEQAVAHVWQEVLGLERPGRNDSFFAVGGDSIRSLKVVAGLRAAGYDVELRDLFTHRSVAELAAALRPRRAVPKPETGAFALLSPADRERFTR